MFFSSHLLSFEESILCFAILVSYSIFMFDQYQYKLTQKAPVMVIISLLLVSLRFTMLSIPGLCPLHVLSCSPSCAASREGGRKEEVVGNLTKREVETAGKGAEIKGSGPRGILPTSSHFCQNFFLFLSSVLRKREAVGKCLFTSYLSCPITAGMTVLNRPM